MTPDEFSRRCDLFAINSRIHRLRIIHGAATVAFIGVMGLLVWSATVMEKHLKIEDLRAQEAQATWKQ